MKLKSATEEGKLLKFIIRTKVDTKITINPYLLDKKYLIDNEIDEDKLLFDINNKININGVNIEQEGELLSRMDLMSLANI